MTTNDKWRVLVFEDKDPNYEELHDALRNFLDSERFQIERFSDRSPEDPENEATKLVVDALENPRPPALVILDWDLTMYENAVRREHVQVGCEEYGIPICVYHREPSGQFSNAEQFMKDQEEDFIKIDAQETLQDIAYDCAVIAEGFVEIRDTLGDVEEENPSSAIPPILAAPPSAESQLDQYSWGQSKAISIARKDDVEDRLRVAATFLGYWIYNQLLKFPGVLLNPVAAASYLGVDHEAFVQDDEYQAPFEDALYDGPFAELGTWWWRAKIDEIRAEHTGTEAQELVSGPELFNQFDLDINPVHCIKGHEDAGYYCILTDEPICKEHSVRPKGWIPIGASQARILTEEFDKVQAWMPD